MKTTINRVARGFLLVWMGALPLAAEPMDVAPFALPLPGGNGLMWEDPREIHRVIVRFQGAAPAADTVRLEYWGSRWPQQRLPKDREPGGGDVGWMELGNWYHYGWRPADAGAVADGSQLTFDFRPVNRREFTDLKDFDARYRYTLKIRVVDDQPLPPISSFTVLTDSVLTPAAVRLAWEKAPPKETRFEVYNGALVSVERPESRSTRLRLSVAANPDPNTFDQTLVTVRRSSDAFTFRYQDLEAGPLWLPHAGVAVLTDDDRRDYRAVSTAIRRRAGQTLYDRVAAMPEQTWSAAWEGMPRKKSDIYFPLGLDGGRQRFRLHASGAVDFRSNDHYLENRPGRDTLRLKLEDGGVHLRFDLPDRPVFRTLAEESLPLCTTVWEKDGVRVAQTAFVTPLEGTDASGPAPAGDTFTVFLAEFALTNGASTERTFQLPLRFSAGPVRLDDQGRLWSGDRVRALVAADGRVAGSADVPAIEWTLAAGARGRAVVKLPYVVLTEPAELEALARLEFAREREAVAGYWRKRLDQSARLYTPEAMLNEFYRSHAMHLLVNCEREPNSDRRFARVGSFGYGAYGNESCMMVVDLDRRGYAREAQNCLDAWLHYQGSVMLPGDFSTKEGILYGAGGYEAGGYNQHHGWILWMCAEHYRFTRDEAWLRKAAPGMVQGADWILKQTARTADRHPLERGLLPAGSLEDIGDWWTWLSTSCYMWRGLDSSAWALTQIQHPDAPRLRQAADDYRRALLGNFRAASQRSPVVRLRDGTAVPKIPSQVHRRGRSFGWICETLEGSLHLLISGAMDPHAPEAAWIVKDYEDNLFLSNQYGYTLENFERDWFSRGGMSMQACLLLNVEPYLYRDDVKHALRGLFNGMAVSYFPDVRMNTEHALPQMDDWRGDHFKSSDESNAAGWLRYLFLREEGDALWVGQAIPREWLQSGRTCGLERGATYFGPTSVLYTGQGGTITAELNGPRRNPPREIRLRFREPTGRLPKEVTVNGKRWRKTNGEWVELPGDIGRATVVAKY